MRIPKGGIAFFDSGIGGLTVLAECRKRLKGELFYYYGDNAHAPYGNLPPEKIRRYVFRAFEKFRRLRVKAVVIACNTATAVCVEELRRKYPFPIIGAEPAIFAAAKRCGRVYVLATKATCESERFHNLYKKAHETDPSSEICPMPCEHLAWMIERNLFIESFDYSPFLPKGNPDTVVLGCTHYIYLRKYIEDFYGCPVLDGNEGIAKQLQRILEGETKKCKNGDRRSPIFNFCRKICPFLTTGCHKTQKTNKKNKCLLKKLKNAQKQAKNKDFFNVFFLGSQKKGNKMVYEQMFASRESP